MSYLNNNAPIARKLINDKPMNGTNIVFNDINYLSDIELIAMDEIMDPTPFNNLQKNQKEFNKKENYYLENLDNIYKFRPDLIALKYYGSDKLYPLVLISNNISSMLKFIPKDMNYKVKIIKLSVLKNIYGL